MRRLSDHFAEAARSCGDLRLLGPLVEDAARELGFDHYALLDHASLSPPNGRLLRIDNYPDDWVEEMVASGYARDDPVHLASRRTNAAFSWCDLGALIRIGPRHDRILDRARHHGLVRGLTVPANVPGEPSASCSFAVRGKRAMPSARLRCAELIGVHALCAARRLRPAIARPHLSRRETDCLKLVALGKTDWEIARILGLSLHTARQYVKRARAAYDTVSRTQLVVYGLRDAWISFEEAIPP
jgi:LuxR family transcriptional regulator, quorum-sensing system regulator CciR